MANVKKICEIIFGANPSESDLRDIVAHIQERLPMATPVVQTLSDDNLHTLMGWLDARLPKPSGGNSPSDDTTTRPKSKTK